MSVFLKNICPFINCPQNFHVLRDLIIHIENDHLDFDPQHLEKLEEERPDTVHLSYVLKFSNPDDFAQYPCQNETVINELDDTTNLNNNYVSYDFEDSGERRLNNDELSQILEKNKLFLLDNSHKKPYGCNWKGCEKRYKNVNGMKYHYKKHHNLLIPNFKKSLLKHKAKPKIEKTSDGPYMQHFESCEPVPNEYFYKFNTMPTSNIHLSSTQVPLQHNMSFNYYNIADGDNYYVPNFDRFSAL